MASDRHLTFVAHHFARDVYVVTEWKDGAVWKTKKVGTVAAFMSHPPIKPGVSFQLVPR